MRDRSTIINQYLINNQDRLYKFALNINGCKEKAKESLSNLNLVWLESNKYNQELTDKKMDSYSIGIIINHKRESKKQENNRVEDLASIIDEVLLVNNDINELNSSDVFNTMYQNELYSVGYNDDQVTKLSRIASFIRTCSPYEINLYKMYFIESLSYRKIAKKCNLHYTTIHYLVNKLKRKLRAASEVPQKPLF